MPIDVEGREGIESSSRGTTKGSDSRLAIRGETERSVAGLCRESRDKVLLFVSRFKGEEVGTDD